MQDVAKLGQSANNFGSWGMGLESGARVWGGGGGGGEWGGHVDVYFVAKSSGYFSFNFVAVHNYP